jgi:hypothetical protein
MKCLINSKHSIKSVRKFTKNLPIFLANRNKPSFSPLFRRPGTEKGSGGEVVEDGLGEVADFDR